MTSHDLPRPPTISLQVADMGFDSPRWLPAQMEVSGAGAVVGSDGVSRHAEASLLLRSEALQSPIHFSRCDEAALWFVDPCAAGKLLPPATCRGLLRHAGLPADQHDAWLAPVPTPLVLARICRNLALHFRREREGSKALLWENAAAGLDPDDDV